MTVADLIRELALRPFDQEVFVRVVSKDGRYLKPRKTECVLGTRHVARGRAREEDVVEVAIVAGEFVEGLG